MAEGEFEIQDVRRLRLEPGDHLVFALPGSLARQDFAAACAGIEAALPEAMRGRVMVISGDVDLTVVSGSQS